MNKNIGVKSIVFIVAVILTVALASGSRAAAQEGAVEGLIVNPNQTIQAVPGGPGFVSISGAAFVPSNSSTVYFHDSAWLYTTDVTETVFYAPVNFPDGAVINQVVVYYYDISGPADLSVALYEYDFTENSQLQLIQLSSIGSGGTGTAFQSLTAEVSNQNNAYFLLVYIPSNVASNIQLAGVRIDYGYSTYLSLINK